MKLHTLLSGTPFSTTMWTRYGSFGSLPYLDSNFALPLWFVFGIGLAFGIFSFGIGAQPSSWDELARTASIPRIIMYLWLGIITLLIGHRQYCYYFGGSKKTDGIFIERLRQVNDAERFLDAFLSVLGGVVAGFIFSPTWWFILLAIYFLFTIVRCHLTLKRAIYWTRDGQNVTLAFVPETVRSLHNGLHVGGVLVGWVLTGFVHVAFAVALHVLLVLQPSQFLFFSFSAGYLTWYLVRDVFLYTIGSRGLRLYPWI